MVTPLSLRTKGEGWPHIGGHSVIVCTVSLKYLFVSFCFLVVLIYVFINLVFLKLFLIAFFRLLAVDCLCWNMKSL